jgi:hypothetical protein
MALNNIFNCYMLNHKIHYIFRNNLGKTVFVKGFYQNFIFKNKLTYPISVELMVFCGALVCIVMDDLNVSKQSREGGAGAVGMGVRGGVSPNQSGQSIAVRGEGVLGES